MWPRPPLANPLSTLIDAGPTPKARRQYILVRSSRVIAETIYRHVTEAMVDAKFDVLDTPHVGGDETPIPESRPNRGSLRVFTAVNETHLFSRAF